MTTTDSWLPLAEYSIKYNVSISTLRRRIKTDDIQFRFDDGKYFLLDETPRRFVYQEENRPSPVQHNFTNPNYHQRMPEVSSPHQPPPAASNSTFTAPAGESVLTAANKLLTDLKKAYTQVLQEKEEQILNLKEEIIDLRTLVKVLESENSRLRDLNQ